MPPDKDDLAYAWDMWSAISQVAEFLEDVDQQAFRADRKLRYAVERLMLIMGEAAGRVSAQFREQHSGVPWQQFVRLRNLIAHDYGVHLAGREWDALRRLLPQAELQLASILPPELRSNRSNL